MKMVKELLDVRAQVKKRKPTYKRIQSNQYAKFREIKWRRPKGLGNKDRRNRKGHIGMVQVGYGSPKKVKGFNKGGFKEIIVRNVNDLKNIADGKTQIAVIGSKVGGKKKLEILNEAKKSKIAIANVKDLDKTIASLTKEPKKEVKKTAAKKESVKEESVKEESAKSSEVKEK